MLAPTLLAAQVAPETRADIDTLLEGDSIDATLFDLPERYFGHVMLLIPDLGVEDQEVLAAAIQQGFEPLRVRAGIVDHIASSATSQLIDPLVASRMSGAEAELSRLMDSYVPEEPFDAFVAGLQDPPTERLRLLAELADARGAGDVDLLLDQALSAAAYRLVTRLGGELGPFRPLSDEAFDAAYRQRILTRALELLHRMGPVPDDLIVRVTATYASEEGRWYVDRRTEAVQAAAVEASQRVESILIPASDAPQQPAVDAPEQPAAESDHFCQAVACGYVVEWRGSPPTGTNGRFGAAGELDARVHDRLLLAGYQLTRGLDPQGLTVRLQPRTTTTICDFLSGTDNRGCLAIEDVRIDFLGSDAQGRAPDAFLVRNRCGSDEMMDIAGISTYVAARLSHALARAPDDRRPGPSC